MLTTSRSHRTFRRSRFIVLGFLGLSILAAASSLAQEISSTAQDPAVDVTEVPSASIGRAPLGERLARRLARSLPGEAIAVRVTLVGGDLPPRGAARRTAIAARQARVLAMPELSGRALQRRYREVPGFAMTIPTRVIENLRIHPEVRAIHLDGEIRMAATEGRALIGSDAYVSLGVLGAGINVAVLDTGYDSDHPDLSSSLVAEQCFCDTNPSPFAGNCCPRNLDEASGPGAAEDDEGHGTSVAAIITGDGVVAPAGVAPAAGIVAVKVLSSTGRGTDSDLDAGLDWVLANHDDPMVPIHVVNLSLSNGGEFDSTGVSDCSTTPVALAIADLAAAGVVVVAASGNDGHDSGIAAPACVDEAISVGGVYDASLGLVGWCGNSSCSTILCTDASAPDVFVCHSNSGSLLDVLAPDWRTTTSEMGGGSANFGGTSAASPYVAGVAALMLELAPGLAPATVRTHLVSAGVSVTNPDNALSFPRVAVAGAIAAALPDCGNGVLDPGEGCDDGNVLGGDCCSEICTAVSAGTVCSDATACTTGDQCDGAGACAGTTIVCDDANACTDDSCDPVLACVFSPNTDPCDDDDACTNGDVCSSGVCAPGPPLDCSDANPCTDDLCFAVGGCAHPPNSASCDDGDACSDGDVCSGGICVPGAPLVCDDTNPCTDDSCDSITGCGFVANSASCDDGSGCTVDDVCSGGSCLAGAALDCDDFDACTADACDEIEGCTHTFIPGCGPPFVPLLGPKGLVGLVFLLLSSGSLLLLALREKSSE